MAGPAPLQPDMVARVKALNPEDPDIATVLEVLDLAKREIQRLSDENARYRSERAYIVGFNDGWDAAIEDEHDDDVVAALEDTSDAS